MFVFLLFSFIFSAKFVDVKNENLNSVLEKYEYNLLLLYSPNFRDGRNTPKFLKNVAHRIEDNIQFVQCDVSPHQRLKEKYEVYDNSAFLLFHRSEFLIKYTGQYTADKIYEFVSNALEEQDVYYPKTREEIFHFQQKIPANIIISNEELQKKAEMLAHNYTQLLHVAVVTNKTLIDELHLPPLLLNKPREYVVTEYNEDCNLKNVIQQAHPSFNFLSNQNLIGRMTLCALYDKSTPFHLYKINLVFNMTKKEDFGRKLRYAAIDFFDAPKYVEQFGVFRFSHPIFFIIGQSLNMWQVCQEAMQPAEDIYYWIRKAVTGEDRPTEDQLLPVLYAHDFMRKVLPLHLDVILFVAAPGMEHYKESKENAETLAKIFKGVKTIKFYEFNSQTEHVQGLQLPHATTPIFSVWPAKEQSGKAFKANIPMNVILEALFGMLKSDTTKAEENMVKERAKPYMTNNNNNNNKK